MTGADGETTATTSPRHTEILNAYRSRESRYYQWALANFGDLRIERWSYGLLSMSWTIDERMVMPDGVMFGGHIASVADHVAGLTTMSVLENSNERFRTARLETEFFRPVQRPRATIEGRLVNASKTLIHVEADFFNAEGKRAVKIAAVQVRRTAG